MERTREQWRAAGPVFEDLMDLRETVWLNPALRPAAEALADAPVTAGDVADAAARLERFAPYLAAVFPETAAAGGMIESPLVEAPAMGRLMGDFPGRLLLKLDSHLPISGSIKARGGIYEVLCLAEEIAVREGGLRREDSYRKLAEPACRELLGRYAVAVGSTGNLGLSIGIMSAMLGFRVTVHMSADARQWKKDLLRSKGVTVVEYAGDYSKAVAEGRRQAQADPFCHFVDDENSRTLFLGYATAAGRLARQLEEMGITVDSAHPLFVYLPCGVGGGPGGVAFGLKLLYGDNVHCWGWPPASTPRSRWRTSASTAGPPPMGWRWAGHPGSWGGSWRRCSPAAIRWRTAGSTACSASWRTARESAWSPARWRACPAWAISAPERARPTPGNGASRWRLQPILPGPPAAAWSRRISGRATTTWANKPYRALISV